MPIRLVIVDDHEMLRDGLKARFAGKSDFTVVGEENGEKLHETMSLSEFLKTINEDKRT